MRRPGSHQELQSRIADRWESWLLAVSLVLVGGATIVQFARSPFQVNDDSALFQHGGWYIRQGATLYVDIWDLKPPFIYGVTAVLSTIARGDMAVLHVLSILVSVGAVIGGVLYTGRIVHRLTGDGFASITAGLSLFTLTSLYSFPWAGIRPKYFAFLCGTAALYYAISDRPVVAGILGALSAGFWQLGAGVALLVVAIVLDQSGVRDAGRTMLGGIAVAMVAVIPFVVTGNTIPLVLETVIAPMVGVEGATLPGRVLQFVVEFGYGSLLVPVAVYGWWQALQLDLGRYWWVAIGGGLYGAQIMLEFQGAIELVLLFVFLAIGVGILVANASTPSRRTILAGVVLLLVLSAGIWQAGAVVPGYEQTAELQTEYDVADHAELPPDPPDVPSMQVIYWEQRTPELCHYRLGHKQKYFAHVTGERLTTETCGRWPYDDAPLPWFVEQLPP